MRRKRAEGRFDIIDPRDSFEVDQEDPDYRREMILRARRMKFMILQCDSRFLKDDRYIIIRDILLKFPSEKVYISFNAPYKASHKIMDCATPEQPFDSHTGFSIYSQATVEKFCECFRRFEGWFYWSFGVFEAKHTAGLSEEAAKGLVLFKNVHVVRPFVDYTIYVGDEFAEIVVICYRESLFDGFRQFAESVRFKSR